MLAIAHAFETFGGLAPCHLCLQQRTVYWVAIGVSLAGLALNRTAAGRRPCGHGSAASWRWSSWSAGCAIAIRHAGAEWHWWAAPEGCSGARRATSADLARILAGGKLDQPRCDVAAWRFLGISMAGWNALISLKLAVLSAVAARLAR